jgi:hypothetical protein
LSGNIQGWNWQQFFVGKKQFNYFNEGCEERERKFNSTADLFSPVNRSLNLGASFFWCVSNTERGRERAEIFWSINDFDVDEEQEQKKMNLGELRE